MLSNSFSTSWTPWGHAWLQPSGAQAVWPANNADRCNLSSSTTRVQRLASGFFWQGAEGGGGIAYSSSWIVWINCTNLLLIAILRRKSLLGFYLFLTLNKFSVSFKRQEAIIGTCFHILGNALSAKLTPFPCATDPPLKLLSSSVHTWYLAKILDKFFSALNVQDF